MARSVLLALAWSAALPAIGGCDDLGVPVEACARPATPEPVPYHGGAVVEGVYMSADWYGEQLHFAGGAYWEIYHQLDEVPRWVDFYLSFERDGLTTGSFAQAAGNQVEIKAIDEETLTVVNGSCVEYWLLVVAGVGDGAPSPP